jgi:hypothetical protein
MSNSVGGGSIVTPATVRANLEWAFIQIIDSNALTDGRRASSPHHTGDQACGIRASLRQPSGNVGAPNERQRCRVAMVCAKASNCDGHHGNTPDKAVPFRNGIAVCAGEAAAQEAWF